MPKTDNEIALDRLYAKNNDRSVGNSFSVAGKLLILTMMYMLIVIIAFVFALITSNTISRDVPLCDPFADSSVRCCGDW